MIHRSWTNRLELLVPEPIQVFVSDFGNVAVSFVAQKSNEFAAAFVIDPANSEVLPLGGDSARRLPPFKVNTRCGPDRSSVAVATLPHY